MFVSEFLAIAAAFCTALSAMLLSELKGRVPLIQLARWQMCAAFAMTALVSLAAGGWQTLGMREFWLLAGSGVTGITLASTTYFATIYAVGPRITALLFSLTSPFALVLGYFALGETVTAWQALGVALVLAGIVLAIGMPRRFRRQREDAPAMKVIAPSTLPLSMAPSSPLTGRLWPGIVLGTVTALGQAVGILLARPAMEAGVEPFTAMAVRSGLAALLFVALAMTPFGRGVRSAVQVSTVSLALGAAILGSALGMSLMMAALERGNAGIVSTLSSRTPILILPLVWIRTRERPSSLAWLGAALAIVGTGFISLG